MKVWKTLVLLFLLTACTPGIDGLIHDQSFGRLSLQQGGLAIGGISTTDKLEPSQGHIFGEMLRQSLQKELKGVAILPENELLYAMSREGHGLMLEEFTRRSLLSAANYNRLKQRLSTRYVALARIDESRVEHERTNEPETLDRNGKVKRPASTTSKSSRYMYVSLYIFDLQAGKRVWGGGLNLSHSVSKGYSNDSSTINFIRGMAAITGGMDSAYPYPPAPDEKDVLNDIFDGFANNLGNLK